MEYREYKISDLFDIVKGKRLTKANMIEGDVNYIGASAFNNGITAKIGNTEHIHPAGTISVCYNGSVGETFYQTEPFWATDDVNVLYPKFEINKYRALYLCAIIRKLGKDYEFVDKWIKEVMAEAKMPLPSKNNQPDWQYIETYIKNLYHSEEITKLLNTPNKQIADFDITHWQPFKLIDLFTYKRGTRIKKCDRAAGEYPLVTAGEQRQGVKGYISHGNQVVFQDAITIDMFCNAFLHLKPFCCDDNVLVLNAKYPMSREVMLFIVSVINHDSIYWHYISQYRQNNLEKNIIYLPAATNLEGNITPDWQFMEDYILSLEYAKHLK